MTAAPTAPRSHQIVLCPADPALAGELDDLPIVPLSGLTPETGPDALILVDWLLPDISGLEFVRRLRADPTTADARIVLVLDDDDREVRARALRAGADDYIVGPLTAAQVRERAAAALPANGHRPRVHGSMQHGGLEIDREAFQVRAGGRPVAIGPNEFNLLAYFLENRDRVLSREELIDALNRKLGRIDERTVDVWVGRLRRALAAAGANAPIRTVRHLGYVFDS